MLDLLVWIVHSCLLSCFAECWLDCVKVMWMHVCCDVDWMICMRRLWKKSLQITLHHLSQTLVDLCSPHLDSISSHLTMLLRYIAIHVLNIPLTTYSNFEPSVLLLEVLITKSSTAFRVQVNVNMNILALSFLRIVVLSPSWNIK